MPADGRPTPLVGRADELRTLITLVGLDGEASGAVVLGGDAGAGKSRLVAELSDRAAAKGWRVLIGHCLDFGDGSPPYLPFSEAFGRLADENTATTDALVEDSPAIARLLPAHRLLTESEARPEPTGQAALYDAVHSALTQLGNDAPLLLIVEDVHWADQSSRDLLRWLFTRQFSAPIAILATYRSDDLHRRHPLRAALAEWVRLPAVSRLQLGPLTDRESRQLVRALHDGAVTEPEMTRILARAEGNPFFIEELVAAATVGGGDLPADLADLLLVRLEQIGDDGRLVVRATSVAGRQISHELLAHGTDLDPAALETAVRSAVEANLLVALAGDSYAFRHALLAEAIYQDLLPGERVRLHAAFAAALSSRQVAGSAAELSRHARASYDLITATRASIQAGAEAMTVGGPEEALRHYELALELIADPRVAAAVGLDAAEPGQFEKVDLVVHASMAAAAAGHPFRAVALAEEELAQLPTDAPKLDRVRLIHAMVRTAQIIDVDRDLLSLTTEAVRLMADEPPSSLRASVLVLHARASADRARDAEAARWATEALQLARDLDLAAIATDATLLLARLDNRAGDPVSAEASITKAIAEAAAAREPMAELRGLQNLGSLHYSQGRLDQAIETFQRGRQKAHDMGRPWEQYGLEAAFIGSIVAYVKGDWPLADQLIDTAGATPPEQAELTLSAMALELAAGRGDVAALARLPRLRSWFQRDGLIAITAGGAAMELLGQKGDIAEACSVFDEVVTAVAAMWQGKWFQARVRLTAILLGQLARSTGASSTADRARLVSHGDEQTAIALEAAAAVRHAGPESIAWAHRVSAENARLHWLAGIDRPTEDELITSWRATVTAFATFGHVIEVARSRARLAAVLAAAGDTAGAKLEADLARESAQRLGASAVLEEIRAVSGADPTIRPVSPRGTESLTPREHDVLVLVATGRSNKEIAQQLFISAKTVSVHISNVLAKLDASSRTEAVAIARRLGLLA